MDYVNFNPVKHGLVTRVRDWPRSSFHRLVRLGVYQDDWAGDVRDKGIDLVMGFASLDPSYGLLRLRAVVS
jgi:hypothetical protein